MEDHYTITQKQYPIGSKFRILETGEIRVVVSYGWGIDGVLIKDDKRSILGFLPRNIEPVKSENGLRLYFFVMYNLSGIQKGIQAGHAAVEYQLEYGETKEYKEFANNHKTFILLDGGGSNDMIEREKELECYGVKFASFQEPDLNYSISAIAFIVPEHIYAKDLTGLDYVYTNDVSFARYLKGFRLASN